MKLKNYIARFRYRYLLGTVCMLLAIALDLASPILTRHIIDDVILNGQMRLLMRLLIGLAVIGFGRAVVGYVKEFTFDWIGTTAANRMRKDVFDHVQTLSVDFFHRHNTGELMTRIKDDVDKVCSAIGFIGMLAVEAAVHTVLVIGCMLSLSPALTLVPLIMLPFIGYMAIRMEQRLGAVYEEISDETAALNTVAEENLAGVRTVKAFTKEEYEIRKFQGRNRKFYDLNMKQARMAATYQPLISFMGKVLLLAVVIVGGFFVIRGKMTLGTLGAFSEYANNIIWPMEILGWLSNDIAQARASWKKICKIMAETPTIKDPDLQDGVSRVAESSGLQEDKYVPEDGNHRFAGRLTFEKVGLELEGKKILEDISFDLPPGKTLGIMGATGTGKSMLINLAQRFYDPTEGRVLLDGTDLRDLPLGQLRAAMAVVSQDVFLFSDTVNQNVRMGQKRRMSAETVRWALQKSDAYEFVSQLSDREETLIGERGVGLSGGQKQRISIARAMSKKAPILILDDATSALDMETEQLIQEDLRQLDEVTKIIIGHRISSVREADEILVLEEGRVLERGTHESLMKLRGQYYRTWCVQFEGQPQIQPQADSTFERSFDAEPAGEEYIAIPGKEVSGRCQ